MEALKFKNYITVILLILTFISCSKGEDKMEIIAYGTPDFQNLAKNAPISLDKAWEIQLSYMKKNITDEFSYKIYEKNVGLFFIVDNYYVFSMGHVNNKMIEGYFLSGTWVNIKTGEVFEKEIRKKIKPRDAWFKK